MSFDAEAGRRSLRIDFGAWGEDLYLDQSACVGASDLSTEFDWLQFTFSGSRSSIYRSDAYCQYAYGSLENDPDPATYLNEALFPSDEAGIAQKIGANNDPSSWNNVYARRYSYLDGHRSNESTQGYQWAFYFFPKGVTLVTLYGEIEIGTQFFDPLIFDWNAEDSLWSGPESGYNGEYWCFVQDTYVGMWDGEVAGTSPLAGCVIEDPTCHPLILTHEGDGDKLVATPGSSPDCPNGHFKAGESINLLANPAPEWISQWDSDTQNIHMPARTATVNMIYEYTGPDRCPPNWVEKTWLKDSMENGEGEWLHSADAGIDEWTWSESGSSSPTHAWYNPATESDSDQRLVSPQTSIISADSYLTQLRFQHKWSLGGSFSNCSDGAIVEYSKDNGSTWVPFESFDIINDSYTGYIYSPSNPLVQQHGWCGEQDWKQTLIDLEPLEGNKLRIRYRLGTGFAFANGGWFIDDVEISGCLPNQIHSNGFEFP